MDYLVAMVLAAGILTRIFAAFRGCLLAWETVVDTGFRAILGPDGYPFPLFVALALFGLALAGPGKYSLDHIFPDKEEDRWPRPLT